MNITSEGQPRAPTEASLQDDTSSWLARFTPGRLAGLIALFLFVLYPGVVLGTHSFFFRDFGSFTYPVAYYAHENFWRGQVPLWNPLNNCGVPFLAQWNTSVCYPLSLIYLLFPLPWSLNYFGLAHLVLAGAGMYLLAYRWTQNRLAASIAGLVFALNGLMLNCLMWTSNLAALSWEPWVLLWVERAWRTGGRGVWIAALAGAMQMLAGAPEIVVFTWVLLGLLWIEQAWRKKIPLGPTLWRFAIVVALIAALSAIQLLPFFDLLKHSERDSSYAQADGWPMPLWGWANFVVPLFHCVRANFGTYSQGSQTWTSSYYLGTGALTLALIAIWKSRRQPGISVVAGMTTAGLILALGNNGYVYAWLKHVVPWIGFARYPIKFVSIPVFTIPLLAACGFSALEKATVQNQKKNLQALIVTATCLLLAIAVMIVAARRLSYPGFDWGIIWRDGIDRALFLIAFVGAIIAWLYVPQSRLRGLLALAVLALIGFDLVTAGMHVNPTVVTKAFGPLELNMTHRPRFGQSRAMVSQQVSSYLLFAGTDKPLYYYVALRGALFLNSNIPENIPKVDGFSSLHLKNEWDIDGFFYGVYHNQAITNAPPAPLLDFLGVSQVSAPDTIFAWQARKAYLPLATAGQRPVFAGDPEALKKLDSPEFDPRHVVYLPLSERNEVTVTRGSDAKVLFQKFGTQSAHLTVQAPAPALVVIAQSYYHDWHAYVDGKPVPLLRANHAFQAVEVPAGQHEITLRYQDWMFRLGAMISALTLLGCLTGFLAKAKR